MVMVDHSKIRPSTDLGATPQFGIRNDQLDTLGLATPRTHPGSPETPRELGAETEGAAQEPRRISRPGLALDAAAPPAIDAYGRRLPSPKLRGLSGAALGAVSLAQQALSGNLGKDDAVGMGFTAGAMISARFVPGIGQALLAYDVADLASHAILGRSLSETALGRPISNALGKFGEATIGALSTAFEFMGWSGGAKYLSGSSSTAATKQPAIPERGFAMDEGSSFRQDLAKSGLINARVPDTSKSQIGFLKSLDRAPERASTGNLSEIVEAARTANVAETQIVPAQGFSRRPTHPNVGYGE